MPIRYERLFSYYKIISLLFILLLTSVSMSWRGLSTPRQDIETEGYF